MAINDIAAQIAKLGIIEKRTSEAHAARVVIKLDGSLPTQDDVNNFNPLLRSTIGCYHIIYSPKGLHGNSRGRPFAIVCDLVNFTIYASNSVHFRELANVYPEVAWLLKYTNYKDDLFKLAKIHPGVRMTFCLDYVEYGMRLFDPNNFQRPFFVADSENTLYRYYQPDKKMYREKVLEANQLSLKYKNEVLEEERNGK